jgi:UDP-2,3-diacylglucosamine hydrolase
MASIIFLADTHLNISQPDKTARVIRFLKTQPPKADIYILGDLFDLWIGPKSMELVDYKNIIKELRNLISAGMKIYFIPGNRDFQVGPEISNKTGIKILPEIFSLTLDSQKILLTHGDIFCTEDKSYQTYRRVSHTRIIKSVYQSLPSRIGMGLGRKIRGYSQDVVPQKSMISRNVIDSVLKRYFNKGYDTIICGHIHKPQKREIVPGKTMITVGSWESKGSYVQYQDGRFTLKEESD